MLHSVLSLAVCNAGKKGCEKAKPAWAETIEQAISPGGLAVLGILLGSRHIGDCSR